MNRNNGSGIVAVVAIVAMIALTAVSGVSGATMSVNDERPNPVYVGYEREGVLPGIVHDMYTFQTDSGMYDKTIVHHVMAVGERGIPIETIAGIMLTPGSSSNFGSNYLAISYDNRDYIPPAISLVRSKMDVWGITFDCSSIPENETDFGFMEEWKVSDYVNDIDIAMFLAKRTRRNIGCDESDPFVLAGFSQGAYLADQYVSKHPGKVDGLIRLDMPGRLDIERDADVIAMAKIAYDSVMEARANGTYHDDSMLYFQQMMQFADEQTILDALTNTSRYGEFVLHQGYCAGSTQEGLCISNLGTMARMTEIADPYQPNILNLGMYGLWAGRPEYQLSGEIECSILNVEAELGAGDHCDSAAKQITEGGNRNVTTIRLPCGHADLLAADDPILWEGYIPIWVGGLKE